MNTESDGEQSHRQNLNMPLAEEQEAGVSRSSSASLSSPPHTSPEPELPSFPTDSLHSITVTNNAQPQGPGMNIVNGVPEKPPRKKPGTSISLMKHLPCQHLSKTYAANPRNRAEAQANRPQRPKSAESEKATSKEGSQCSSSCQTFEKVQGS